MQSKDLVSLGKVLFGERWQTALSKAMQVSDRTVRNWISGKYSMPERAQTDLIVIAARLQAERICKVMADAGAIPSEITLQVHDSDKYVRHGNLSAGTHSLIAEQTAKLLTANGIPARTVKAVK